MSNLLHHPIYAGAYVYGRRPTDPRRKQPGRPSTGRLVAKPEACQVLLKDRLPAYISWEQFERNQCQLEANTQASPGVIRRGSSLLSGLVVCGHCGYRMAASYNNNGLGLRYNCSLEAINYGGALCQSLVGKPLDALVSELVLRALEPAALEVSLQVAADIEGERQRLHQQWQHRLERARYAVERAQRQYNAVEPENRLVARTLERQWEAALGKQAALEADHVRFLAEQPATLTTHEREAIRRLSRDIPGLWHAPSSTAADHQAIVRQLVERVVIRVQGNSEKVDVEVHWVGGHGTQTTLIRPVARLAQLSYYPDLLSRIKALYVQGSRRSEIAHVLGREGWRPPKRRPTFTPAMVGDLLARLAPNAAKRHQNIQLERRADERTLAELVYTLKMPYATLYSWLRKGHLQARLTSNPARWLIWADAAELARLRTLSQAPQGRMYPAAVQ